MVVEVMSGVWLVEQPGSSLLRYHPRVCETFLALRVFWLMNEHVSVCKCELRIHIWLSSNCPNNLSSRVHSIQAGEVIQLSPQMVASLCASPKGKEPPGDGRNSLRCTSDATTLLPTVDLYIYTPA